ncbi:hypothetical protein [Saccharicrinis fermentans]
MIQVKAPHATFTRKIVKK